MCRCRRYIRFIRRVASIGHEAAAPISREYADIRPPRRVLCFHSLRCSRDKDVTGRTRRGTESVLSTSSEARSLSPVAKLQRGGDILIELLIRGMDERTAD